jgi:cytochrome c553
MQGMAAALSEEDMKHIAAFYASQARPKAGFAQEQGHRAPGRADLPRRHRRAQGAGLRRLPQPQRRRHPGAVPAPGGQHAEYTEAQLLPSARAQRANNAQMMTIAGKMNDAEIKAVSDYIAGLR